MMGAGRCWKHEYINGVVGRGPFSKKDGQRDTKSTRGFHVHLISRKRTLFFVKSK